MRKREKRKTISQQVVNYLQKKLNFTLEEIASLARVQKETLLSIEKGESKFTAPQLRLMQGVTGKKMSELILP